MNTRTNRLIGLTVGHLLRSAVYKPLAILMSILLLPAVSWMQGGNAGARPFQASAQITLGGCTSQTNSIIQTYCVNGVAYPNDLVKLESDAVNAYLGEHGLPATDAHVIYDYGRSDLRTEVRANMLTTLLGIAAEPASKRSTHEQNLYQWFQALVQNNEIALYTNAINQWHVFQNDPCHFTLDPDIASVYGLHYDGTPFCFGGLQSSIFSAPVPSETYFLAYGIKQSYGAPTAHFPYYSTLVAGTGISAGEIAGISLGAGAVVAAAAGTAIAVNLTAALAAFNGATGIVSGLTAASPAFSTVLVSGAAVNAIGLGGLVAAPVAIIFITIATAIVGLLEVISNQQITDDLNNLSNTLNQVTNTPPDLNAMALDTSGLGMYKLQATLTAQTVPEVASTTTLPTHQATDLNFNIQANSSSATNVSSTLSYQDWYGNVWSAQSWGGWFVETCSNGANSKCTQADSITTSIEYVDSSKVKWTASRNGNTFTNTKAQPAPTDIACPADPSTGVSLGPDFSNCISYVSTSIPLKDNNGNQVSVSLSTLAPPVFTSTSYLAFGPSIPSTQTITVSGNPTPSVCVASSNLPANFTLNGNNCGSGSFQVAFDGASNAPEGNYSLVLQASNSAGSVQQTFSMNVSPQLAIISPGVMNVTAGVPASFTVVATGNPTPQLSVDPLFAPDLDGLTFTDNGNGTATISGIYSSTGVVFTCQHVNPPGPSGSNCGIIATNSQGTVEQQFAIHPAFPPSPVVAGCSAYSGTCSGATFIAGAPNQVLLSATGATTPVSWSFFPGFQQPAWLSLHDNGNGTAVLSGTPPAGTTGTFNLSILPQAAYAMDNGYSYPLTVVDTPIFTSANIATLTIGTAGSFSITASAGTIGLGDTLPKALSFVAAGDTASISGTPAGGTGGQYVLLLTDNASTGSTTQSLTLNVNEGPQITSANTATMFVGMPGLFAVTTTGFPSVSSHVIPANAQAPTDPSQGEGMYFTVTGLPSDLQFSNFDPEGFATGTLTIQGTPSAADIGTHQVQITAQNGVGTAATQILTLDIVNITGPAPASTTTCNGNYNGTFKGNITVSSGQNCAFYGGGVNGNVAVNGGHVALNNATISGNVGIQGGSGFSIGPGTKIGGNLSIQNVASGSTASQICESTVSGNLQISSNAIPIQIGNPQSSCFGNSFGENVAISANTASVTVYGNNVVKNLSCSGNSSMTGGGNTAQKKSGQCAPF